MGVEQRTITVCDRRIGADASGMTRGVWKQLADQWALVTGASSGLGAEFARQLAGRGMHLVLTARRKDLLDELAAELHAKHATRCEVIACDLSIPGEPLRLIQEISRRGVRIDLLLNNAGFGVVGEIEDAQVDRLLELVRLNIAAAVELTYRYLPGMLERKHGAIINMSSLSAFQPVAYMSVYASSKAFLLHFSEALAVETRDRNVAVLAVCPGVTRTPFFDIAGAPGWLQKHASHSPERVVRTALDALGRKQVIVIGWKNYFLTLLVRIASRARVVKESMRFFRPRRKDEPRLPKSP
jgi:short-subunit dehydrogenase